MCVCLCLSVLSLSPCPALLLLFLLLFLPFPLHTSRCLPTMIVHLSRTLLYSKNFHIHLAFSPLLFHFLHTSFISFTFLPNSSAFLPTWLSSYHSFFLPLLPLLILPSAWNVISQPLPPPQCILSFLLTAIPGWQMINIWPSHVGKFNAFSEISPQSSNICKFLSELRKSSIT